MKRTGTVVCQWFPDDEWTKKTRGIVASYFSHVQTLMVSGPTHGTPISRLCPMKSAWRHSIESEVRLCFRCYVITQTSHEFDNLSRPNVERTFDILRATKITCFRQTRPSWTRSTLATMSTATSCRIRLCRQFVRRSDEVKTLWILMKTV